MGGPLVNLHELAWKYDCDKGPRRILENGLPHGHGYTLAYEREFERFLRPPKYILATDSRDLEPDPGSLLEIGVQAGNSMLVWDEYFPENWKVVGVDIDVPREVRELTEAHFKKKGRVHLVQGDSTRLGFAKDVQHEFGQFDVVIDDGSHYPAHQVATLQNFWPLVKPGGIYCLEDLHQSYWPASLKQNTIVPVLVELIEDCIGRGKFAEWSGVPAADPVVRPEEEVLFSVRAYRNMVVFEKRVP